MKKFLLLPLILVAGVVAGLLYFKKANNKSDVPPTITSSASATITQPEITGEPSPTPQTVGSGYKTSFIIVNDIKKLKLYYNLEEALSSSSAATKNSCLYLVSGGFYSEDKKPIGLFVTEGTPLSQYRENKLLNGILAVSDNGYTSITALPPAASRIAIQSGPLLIRNKVAENLTGTSDSKARRVVAALNVKRNLVFIVFYAKTNPVDGPMLSELPGLLGDMKKINSDLVFTEALNLDGGSHSALINDVVNLSELGTIGSYFCIKA